MCVIKAYFCTKVCDVSSTCRNVVDSLMKSSCQTSPGEWVVRALATAPATNLP
jgi:hypothetical protein